MTRKAVVHMIVSLDSYLRRGRQTFREWLINPKVHILAETGGCIAAGFLLSAASLVHQSLPLTLALVCVSEGLPALLIGLGGCAGYVLFWGQAGFQGLLWLAAGTLTTLILGRKRLAQDVPFLMPAIAGLIVSASGVIFQIWMADETSIPVYLLRIMLAAAGTYVFAKTRQRQDNFADWLAGGLVVLALAQISPFPGFNLGLLAAGIISVQRSFPAAALAGLALDLAQITPIPMTGVLVLGQLFHLLPRESRWLSVSALPGALIAIMALMNRWDFLLLPCLFLGSLLGTFIPHSIPIVRHRGETGVAQVRLELAAGVLAQAEQLLLETQEIPVDDGALMLRAVERACGNCQNRKHCKDMAVMREMSPELLHLSLIRESDLPVSCRKSGRLIMELHRAQEQLRSILGNRDRIRECRWAVIQQFQFLSRYLQELSDQLTRKPNHTPARYRPDIGGVTAGRERADGDRCLWFAGTGGRYYVLLCDGMGTGLGAAQDSADAVAILRRLLTAGYPPEYALRSLNSLTALRGRAGAVSVDLAELHLDTGKASLYKWGAAPSYLLMSNLAEKIGTAGPPPGLSVTDGRETVERLSLRRGETLVLLSDGVDGEVIPRHIWEQTDLLPGEMASKILELGRGDGADDATVVVVRLTPEALST